MKAFLKIFPGLKFYYDLDSGLCEEVYQSLLQEKGRILREWCYIQSHEELSGTIMGLDIDILRIRVIEDEECECPYFSDSENDLLDDIQEDALGGPVFFSREMYLEVMNLVHSRKPTVEDNDSHMEKFLLAAFILAGYISDEKEEGAEDEND